MVSLTLTPLMCARLLKDRGRGAKRTWVERVIGGVEKRVLARLRAVALVVPAAPVDLRADLGRLPCRDGRALHGSFPRRSFPSGDSSFIWGVMIAREGSSPEQMRALPGPGRRGAAARIPRVNATFTMTGNEPVPVVEPGHCCWCSSSRPRSVRPSRVSHGQLMGELGTIPGVFRFLRPSRCWRSARGRPNRNQGQYRLLPFRGQPQQVYEVAGKLMGKLSAVPGDFRPSPPTISTTRPISTSTSAATRPRRTGCRRRGS